MTISTPHPLDPLSSHELKAVVTAVRLHASTVSSGRTSLKFTYITLLEPLKASLVAYLGIATSSTTLPSPAGAVAPPPRRAECAVIETLSGTVHVYHLGISGGEARVESEEILPEGVHVGITLEELDECEEIVKRDPEVIRLCAEVGIAPHQIVCDGWAIGWDDRFPVNTRLQQALMYSKLSEHDNPYAHPLDFTCVIDTLQAKVLYIDFAAHRLDSKTLLKVSGQATPHDITLPSLPQSGRERISPPLEPFNYLPELVGESKRANGDKFEYRNDIKPIQISQPEGVSFTLDGNHLKWQNWDVHIGYNYREGVILNTVQYFDKEEGRLRPILYRASLADMVVPYAAPESPAPRKHALDVSEYCIGLMANTLSLGCDCLGSITYLDTSYVNHSGTIVELKKVVCIHEEDAGVLWKHTDYRSGKVQSVRGRKLVIQTVVTVANYEYVFAWNLSQDGSIEYEVKLTGVLNLYVAAKEEKDTIAGLSFGTQVAPQIMAPHHQHIFSLRIDPMIDGISNSVVETDIIPLSEFKTEDPLLDWAGNGFVTQKTVLRNTDQGPRDMDYVKGRTWSFVNEDKKHYASGQPVGYKIMCRDMPPLMARPGSLVQRRTPFASHALWTIPYVDQTQLYPAGKHSTQTREAPEDSLEGWARPGQDISGTDIVSFISFGVTHIPRPEDFPVMPREVISLILKPVGFFRSNPAGDVPATQDVQSVLSSVANGTCC